MKTEKANKQPKVALVCDWLTEIGGAEQVLLSLTRIFPEAPIYTSQYRPKHAPWFSGCKVYSAPILNLLPRCLRKFMAPLRAFYFNHLKIKGYDVVISVANAESKGVKTPSDTLHIAYLQGPPTQYYWGKYNEYITNPGFGKLNWLARWGLKLLLKPMRKSDLKASQRPDIIVANSRYVLREVKCYYHRDGTVIHPPVRVEELGLIKRQIHKQQIDQVRAELFQGQDFYLVVGRQVNWKRFDLAISACGQAVENLLVVGDGAEHAKLVNLAKKYPFIKFLPKYNSPAEIAKYFIAARGLIFPSHEPFGIIPVEALACSCPILAFSKGGSEDIVTPKLNGMFFNQQTTNSLALGIKRFNVAQFDRQKVAESAEPFSKANFKASWQELLKNNYKEGKNNVS